MRVRNLLLGTSRKPARIIKRTIKRIKIRAKIAGMRQAEKERSFLGKIEKTDLLPMAESTLAKLDLISMELDPKNSKSCVPAKIRQSHKSALVRFDIARFTTMLQTIARNKGFSELASGPDLIDRLMRIAEGMQKINFPFIDHIELCLDPSEFRGWALKQKH